MATPHVGGMAGLILDVAPSLGVADYHREDHDFGDSLVGGEAAVPTASLRTGRLKTSQNP